jgi:hypothetical protein
MTHVILVLMVLPNFRNPLLSLIPFWRAALALVLECYVVSHLQKKFLPSNSKKIYGVTSFSRYPLVKIIFLKIKMTFVSYETLVSQHRIEYFPTMLQILL